jgi:hypothetical protein
VRTSDIDVFLRCDEMTAEEILEIERKDAITNAKIRAKSNKNGS